MLVIKIVTIDSLFETIPSINSIWSNQLPDKNLIRAVVPILDFKSQSQTISDFCGTDVLTDTVGDPHGDVRSFKKELLTLRQNMQNI